MRRKGVLLLALPAVVAVAGCTDELDVPWRLSSPQIPFPFELPTPAPTPIPISYGDGRDGDRTLTTGATPITDCWPVVAGTGATVSLTVAAPLFSGDVLLLHQTQDVFATVPTSSPMFAVGDAGLWETAVVASAGGTTVALQSALTHAYDSTGARRAQSCRIRQYRDVTVRGPATLTARDWNGTSGGILAVMVSGTLTLTTGGLPGVAGALTASHNGFRAGIAVDSGNVSDVTAETTPDQAGGAKGEGLDGSHFGLYGRGNAANGGGGGNGLYAGAGGGGGYGSGGAGGKQAQGAGDIAETAGRAGAGAGVADRILFGGGGGIGHATTEAGTGGVGGGVLLLFARQITGQGGISTLGGDGLELFDTEGAPGGGGGGTVVLAFAVGTGWSGSATAFGGAGGSNQCDGVNHCGPGGGGGGGSVLLLEGALPASRIDVSGGPNGTNKDGVPWNAQPGEPGSTR